MPHHCGLHCVLGPAVLEHVAVNARSKALRRAAARTMALNTSQLLHRQRVFLTARTETDEDLRRRRTPLARTVRDARHREIDAGPVLRNEGQDPCGDPSADEAYEGLGQTFNFYLNNLERNGIDGRTGSMLAVVHYGKDYDNAFYDGDSMQFGDGDGELFNRFTIALDVIGHELTHGVTGTTAGLVYAGQPGALNESVSDRMGCAIRQLALGLGPDDPDGWLVGKGLLAEGVQGKALRDMLNPGTAYDDPQLGKDPQPADLAHYVHTRQDQGGVHTNSGIPNRAFALLAQSLGDVLAAARITYATLKDDLVAGDANFVQWATREVANAREMLGEDAAKAALDAWATVGVLNAQGEPAA